MPKAGTFDTATRTLNMASRLSCLEGWTSPPNLRDLKEEYPRFRNYDWAGCYAYSVIQGYVTMTKDGKMNRFTLTDEGKDWISRNRPKIQNLKTCILYEATDEQQLELIPKPEEIPEISKDRYTAQSVRILLKLDEHIMMNTPAKTKRLMKRIELVIDEEAIK